MLASAWGIFITLIFSLFGWELFGLFLQNPALMDMGRSFLRILAICQIFGCLEAVASGTFRGFGRTIPPSFVSITSNALRVPLAYALSRSAMGVNGVWLGIALGATLRGCWIFAWFLIDMRSRPKTGGRSQ
jgi:Na+-driven multidrug efflux pump